MRFLFCLLLLSTFVGCGQSTYETRLGETTRYYEYLNETESVLDRSWKSRGPIGGIEIRPPAKFRKISEPKVEKDEDGTVISVGIDERQPRNIPGFYQGELPGIEGAFKKTLDVRLTEGKQQFNARMYVLAREFLGTGENDLPFRDVVYNQLASDLRVESSNSWRTESYPTRDLYARSVDYYEMRFSPGIAVNGFTSSGVVIQLNAHEAKGKEVVVMWVIPDGGLDSQESKELKTGIAKSLQTLEVRKATLEDESSEPEAGDDTPAKPRKKPKKSNTPAF
ncbi:MAG: hypothetical protein KDA65_17545 [Planctomycetaceae bacterium]|nr:hypothetical protein [Planctomycetaceae bacterium]